ncbi:MAG: hypothetical protein ACE5D7_09420 [Fidelibacterota bacterium]
MSRPDPLMTPYLTPYFTGVEKEEYTKYAAGFLFDLGNEQQMISSTKQGTDWPLEIWYSQTFNGKYSGVGEMMYFKIAYQESGF